MGRFDNFSQTSYPDNRFRNLNSKFGSDNGDSIIIGANCTHIFELPFLYSNYVKDATITYKQGFKIILDIDIESSKSSVEVEDNETTSTSVITVNLTPFHTQLFDGDTLLDTTVQLKIRTVDGEIYYDTPHTITVSKPIEKDSEEITQLPPDEVMSSTSINVVQNKVVKEYIDDKIEVINSDLAELADAEEEIEKILKTVVYEDDERLTNSRQASDVYEWAKAEEKPTYTKEEVGLGNVLNVSSYSKTEVDNKLNNKANSSHTHTYSTLTGTPASLKNPYTLSIITDGATTTYDGSVRRSVDLSNLATKTYVDTQVSSSSGGGSSSKAIVTIPKGSSFKINWDYLSNAIIKKVEMLQAQYGDSVTSLTNLLFCPYDKSTNPYKYSSITFFKDINNPDGFNTTPSENTIGANSGAGFLYVTPSVRDEETCVLRGTFMGSLSLEPTWDWSTYPSLTPDGTSSFFISNVWLSDEYTLTLGDIFHALDWWEYENSFYTHYADFDINITSTKIAIYSTVSTPKYWEIELSEGDVRRIVCLENY